MAAAHDISNGRVIAFEGLDGADALSLREPMITLPA
jgi:hypothetical protein